MMKVLVRAAMVGATALVVVAQTSAATSTSGQEFGAACTGGRYTVPIYKEDFENNAASRWATGGYCGGCFEIGQPQASWDATGYKQLWYTPSQSLDPRFWIQGPNALVTGIAGGSNPYAYDLDGYTTANSLPYQFVVPSGRTVFMDFSYSFAYDTTSSNLDLFQVSVNVPSLHAKQDIFTERGTPANKSASWTKKTINLSAYGLNDRAMYVSAFAYDEVPAGIVEAALDDILVYYCQ